MKSCKCGSGATLTINSDEHSFQVCCDAECGRETFSYLGTQGEEDALDAWEKDKVSVLYSVKFHDESLAETFENTFSSYSLKTAAAFACFCLQNNIYLISVIELSPLGHKSYIWGGDNECDCDREANLFKREANLFKIANIELKYCKCHSIIQTDSNKCASGLCEG